jgi:hypothetical protein
MKNKQECRELLDDMCGEYCSAKYCILKEFLIQSHYSPRLLMQMSCIDKFKYEKGVELDREIKWAEAVDLWIECGYADTFSIKYEEGKHLLQLYKEVIEG